MRNFILILLICGVLFTGCTQSNVQQPPVTLLGGGVSNIGNTFNGSGFFEYKGSIYGRLYVGHDGKGYYHLASRRITNQKLENDTTLTILDSDSDVSNVIVYKDHVYYKNVKGSSPYEASVFEDPTDGAIYRCNLDGSNRIRLTDVPVSCFYIYDNDILLYQYGTYDEEEGPYTEIRFLSLETMKESVLYTSEKEITDLFSTSQDKIFLLENHLDLYSVDVNGKEEHFSSILEKSGITWVTNPVPYKNQIFFNGSTEEGVYTFSLDLSTKEVKKVIEESTAGYTIDQENMYVIAYPGGEFVHIMLVDLDNFSDKAEIGVINSGMGNPQVIGDILILEYYDGFYYMPKDGGELTHFVNLDK